MKRHAPTVRGDKPGQIRIKWEWYDSVVGSYLYERRNLIEELSEGEKFLQDLFNLGPDDDDKLLPFLSHYSILASAPAATFEGLMLNGKQGEVKGAVTRKYMAPGVSGYAYVLEYRKPNGDLDVYCARRTRRLSRRAKEPAGPRAPRSVGVVPRGPWPSV
jgi:hypothetical protein